MIELDGAKTLHFQKRGKMVTWQRTFLYIYIYHTTIYHYIRLYHTQDMFALAHHFRWVLCFSGRLEMAWQRTWRRRHWSAMLMSWVYGDQVIYIRYIDIVYCIYKCMCICMMRSNILIPYVYYWDILCKISIQ